MRITDTAMNRNYLRNVQRNLGLYNKSGERLQSGRRFNKMSENVSDGTRALNVRAQIYRNEQYQENADKCTESLSVAETNMTNIEDILNNVWNTTIQALNGTNESASDIFSINFASLKNQVLEFSNCKYNDMYVLGGTNNQSEPFEDIDGVLYYNGINVNTITKEGDTFYVGELYGDDEPYLDADGNMVPDLEAKVPYSESIFMDIGIGLKVKDGVVDPRSAFNMSVSGLDALGYGVTEVTYTDVYTNEEVTDVFPNNAYELLDEMSKAVAEKDYGRLGALNDHLRKTIDGLVTEIADVGVRTKYLENHTDRLEDESFNLTKIQSNLEYINDVNELRNNKMLEYSWLLTLQYGAKVIPRTLMEYIQG